MHQLILASQSPRRLQLLNEVGIQCTVDPVKVSEIIDENLNLEDAIAKVAWLKVQPLVERGKYPKGQRFLILGADTVVVLDKKVLGKPRHVPEAIQFLRLLSGKRHRVISGIAVFDVDSEQKVTATDTTIVEFRDLSENEIQDYVKSGEPMDKAGAYAIQGGGKYFVKNIEGSHSNVVGLPLELWERLCLENDWKFARLSR